MSRIVIGQSGDKNVHLDLDVLLRTRLLVQANSGGGKSFCIRRIVEQAFGKIQIIIIDPEGEFATLREKYSFVLAGKGGDTPADIRSAELLAQRLLELRASCVCDIFEMKPFDRHRWVKLFLDSMLNAPKKLWHPVLVVVDEAHKYAPEKGAGESEASESMVGLCTTGRKRGFCAVFATQRLGKLRKDASAELLNRLVGPTFEDVDRKRAADLLGILKSDEKEFFHQIQLLEPGNFFALGRAITTERLLVKVGPVSTTHPEVGAKYSDVPPPPPEKVIELLPQLADLPKQAEDRARTVQEMQSEIKGLKQQLRQRPTETKAIVDEDAVNRAILKAIKPWSDVVNRIRSDIKLASATVEKLSSILHSAVGHEDPINKIDRVSYVGPNMIMRNVKVVAPTLAAPHPARSNGSGPGVSLPPGERAVMIAVGQFGSVEREQLTVLTGYKRSSRDAYISRLAARGFIEIQGRTLRPTQDGIDSLGGDYEPLPTGSALYEHWRNRLPEGELKILDILVKQGSTMNRSALDDLTEYKRSSRDAYLSRLMAKRLIEVPQSGMVKAADALFD